jgi:uncharacterized membrane protein YkvA (DUF1232 family)
MPDQRNGEIASPQSSPLEIKAADTADSTVNRPSVTPSALDPMWQVIRRLPKYARLSAALARDPRVPATSKAMLVAGGIYLVSPIDLVPGIIPVAGQLDDLYVVLTGLQQAIRTSPPGVIDEHFAAIGLSRSSVDEDLATIRAFVRRGVAWSIQKGGQLISRLSKQATYAAQRARRWGESLNDQKPL